MEINVVFYSMPNIFSVHFIQSAKTKEIIC